MRITSMNQLATELGLPPSSLAALRKLSLDDVAKLNAMIEQAEIRQRAAMNHAIANATRIAPAAKLYERLRRRT
jgi:hypothetical protein